MNGPITLYRADTTGNAQNCLYRHEVVAETPQQLTAAVRFDHVFAKFSGNRRSNEAFEYADLLVLDCDNDHSDSPEDWVFPEDLKDLLPGVACAVYSSRHSDLPKGSRSARPRFHAVFPIPRITDAGEYAALKKKASGLLPFFDRNALDAGRFFFGVENAKVLFLEGTCLLTDWLEEEARADAGTEAAIPEGSRNQTLHRFAVKTLMQQRDTEAARRSFRREAEKCVPPLAEEELERIWRSAGKYARIARSQPEAAAQKAVSPVRPPEWEEPIPLDGPELMPFPVEALPKAVAGYVLALSESLQVPPDMAAACALGALSVCLQKKFAVRINSDWVEPVNLYLAVVADPSERKSPCIKHMISPIEDFEEAWNIDHDLEIQTSRKLKNAHIRRVETLEKKVADGKASEEELREAIEKERNFIPQEKLRLFLDDVTPEKLTSQMAANGGMCSIMSAEGGIFETFAGRYSGSANFDVALKSYSGDPIRVDRATRPSETIQRPALTLLLMIQPEVLSEIMGNRAFRGKGLTARILYSIPKSRAGSRSYRVKTVPPEIRQNYNDLLFRLLSIEQGQTEEVLLSPEAEEIRLNFSEAIERKLPKEFADFQDWAGKIAGTTMRIAALLCLAEAGPDDLIESWEELPHYEITKEQMARAAAIGTYFIEHARAAYCRMGASGLTAVCRRVLDVLIEKKPEKLTQRTLMRLCRFLETAEAAQPVLNHLEDLGYLILSDPEEARRNGRHGNPVYLVNPLLFKEGPSAAEMK